VRVTLAGGERLVIRDPRVVADSLLGMDVTGERKGMFVAPLLAREGRRTPIGLPLAMVRDIATRRVSALKTGLYVGECSCGFSWRDCDHFRGLRILVLSVTAAEKTVLELSEGRLTSV